MPSVTPTWERPSEVRSFVAQGLWAGCERFADESVALGFVGPDDRLVAGFVYHNWNPTAGLIELSGYSSRRDWTTRAVIREIFAYPFDVVGVRMVVARHSEHNRRVIRIWNALGATQYRIPDLRGPDEAEIICTYSREAWRKYLEKGTAYGQAIRTKAA